MENIDLSDLKSQEDGRETIGVNLCKAFLSGMENQGTSDSSDTSRKYYQVDSFVHEYCKLFGQHEYMGRRLCQN